MKSESQLIGDFILIKYFNLYEVVPFLTIK